MSKIPPLTTLRTEDYPSEERAWLPRLFLPLNQFLTAVTNCLNGRVDFGANIPAVTQQLSFVYDGMERRIPWGLPLQPAIVWTGQAYEFDEAISVSPLWSYDSSTKIVSLSFLRSAGSELTVGNSYKILVRIVP